MSNESIAKTGGIVALSVMMLAFSYLFNQSGESNVSLLLLFVGVILALALAFDSLYKKK